MIWCDDEMRWECDAPKDEDKGTREQMNPLVDKVPPGNVGASYDPSSCIGFSDILTAADTVTVKMWVKFAGGYDREIRVSHIRIA